MAQTVSVLVSPEDRARLTAILGDRNRPLKHVQRAKIVLFSADRLPVLVVAGRAEVSRPAVWRWQLRYAEQGVDGLLRDKTRKPGRAPLTTAIVAKVLALTCSEPPGAVTHWTGRAVAARIGISLRAVQRIWETHRLQPHRLRTFKRSSDPAFAAKVEDVVGLYMDPPGHAVVLSIDEKSQIQALDRTQPGLPLKPGKCGTMTHDYKRNGTTTLFAALNTLDGTVIGRCMPRHTHKEFLAFLKTVERSVPPGKIIHAITDNYATHTQPDVLRWLAEHPRWVFHFTPTSGSWLNAVEGFFSALTRRRLRRGVFRSVAELQDAIAHYIREHNRSAKPFVWAASAQSIFDKLTQTPEPSE
jgi:transposase